MHRVYVAKDAQEALGFLRVLESHAITARMIEDQDFPERGEIHDVDHVTEVWIADPQQLEKAQELALRFEDERLHPKGGDAGLGDG